MSQATTFQIILSSDGKHTVIATTDQMEMTEHAQAWATSTYDALVQRYGLKHEQYPKPSGANGTSSNGNDDNIPTCAMHHLPMSRQQGRHGPFWSCHQRNQDGSFCTYRPNSR